MRIALLTDGLWPLQVGGMEKHSWYFARHLAQSGHEVHVYFPVSANDGTKQVLVFKESQGITEHGVPEPKRGKLPGHYLRESREMSSLFLQKIRPRISQFDIIYAQGFAGWELLQAKKNGMVCPPVWVNFHGLEMFQPAPGIKAKIIQFFFRPAVIENLKMANAVISLGGALGPILRKAVENRVQVIEIPIGIESNWLRAPETISPVNKPLRFVFIGRNEKRKGLVLLNSVLNTMKERTDFRFDFIGPIPENEKLISKNITYHGMLREEQQIRDILWNSDVIVSPSYAEGMPTVILEAMASGLAVCATNVGAVNCLIKENGLLFEPGNADALKNSLEYFLAMPAETLLEQKLASIQLVQENFTWEKVIKLTLNQMKTIEGV